MEVVGEVGEEPVLVRDGRLLLATFHPELTDDLRVHARFLDLVRAERGEKRLAASANGGVDGRP